MAEPRRRPTTGADPARGPDDAASGEASDDAAVPADDAAVPADDPAAERKDPAAAAESGTAGRDEPASAVAADGPAARRDDTAAPAGGGTPETDGAEGSAPSRAGARSRRRYPTFTRSVVPPEGGRRLATGSSPAPIRQWPLLCVLGGALLGLVVLLADFRIGLLIVGGSLLAGAALRLLLPAVGMLAVRSRFTDVLTYGALGVLIVLLTLMAQPSPWLELPFLNDILRFSAGG